MKDIELQDYRIISIGTLSSHPLWNEGKGLRTAHATTTLIRGNDRVLLIDPALPSQALAARLFERTGLQPAQVTDVFLTNFRPSHRAGLGLFEHANWWISEAERETIGLHLLHEFEQSEDEDVRQFFRREIAILQRCKVPPDTKVAGIEQVDLFPLPGYTPGTTGLLLTQPSVTILIASDAVATSEHLSRGQILSGAMDIDRAMESLKEAIEIADWIVPGHDNIVPNLTRRLF